MTIYQVRKGGLVPIKEKAIKLEKDLQKLTEENLQTVFGLEFVRTEFGLHNLYIDTLAFDTENKSFIIIEYKRDKSFSVVDQGYAYLALMLNNKADFILEYNERKQGNLKRDNVDWSQSKVLFLANSFTRYQQSAINFKDLPIELWEVKLFDNDTILYNQLKPSTSSASIKDVSKDKTISDVTKEVKVYTLDDHFSKCSDEIKDLFLILQAKIIELSPDVKEYIGKSTLPYKVRYLTFIYVTLRQREIHLDLRLPDDIELPTLGKKREVKESDVFKISAKIKSEDDIYQVMSLIKKAYQETMKLL